VKYQVSSLFDILAGLFRHPVLSLLPSVFASTEYQVSPLLGLPTSFFGKKWALYPPRYSKLRILISIAGTFCCRRRITNVVYAVESRRSEHFRLGN